MMHRWLALLSCLAHVLPVFPSSPAASVTPALQDTLTRPVEDRPHLYHVKLDHFPRGSDRQEQWQLLSGLVNGTSHRRAIYRPRVILLPEKPGQPLVEADGLEIAPEDWGRAILARIEIDRYGYEKKTLELLRLVEPHFHHRDKKVQTVTVQAPLLNQPAVVTPAPAADPDGLVDGVQFYRDGDRGTIVEVQRQDIKVGETLWVRQVLGGPIQKMTAMKRTARPPPAQAPASEVVKGQEKLATSLHGEWLPAGDIIKLAKETNSDAPLALSDWLWWQLSIQTGRAPGPGYYDLLKVKNQDDFHARVAFDPKTFREKFAEFTREYRAAQKDSGVAQQPRRISVENTFGGEIWITFDNEDATEERNPLERPDNDFKYKATEQFGPLANGWLAQGLFVGNDPGAGQKEGDIQNSAPDFIGPDKTATGNDGRIHAGICWRCHKSGLKPVEDYYQKVYQKPLSLGIADKKKALTFEEQYFGRLQQTLEITTKRHAAAVFEATGLTLEQYSALIGKWWKRTEDAGVSLERAAREIGCTPERLIGSWALYKKAGQINGNSVVDLWLRTPRGTIPYRQWLVSITEVHKAIIFSEVKP